jgi:hypothetical protein
MSDVGGHRFPLASRHADGALGNSYNRIVRKCYAYSVIFVKSQTRRIMYTGIVGDEKDKYHQPSHKSQYKNKMTTDR